MGRSRRTRRPRCAARRRYRWTLNAESTSTSTACQTCGRRRTAAAAGRCTCSGDDGQAVENCAELRRIARQNCAAYRCTTHDDAARLVHLPLRGDVRLHPVRALHDQDPVALRAVRRLHNPRPPAAAAVGGRGGRRRRRRATPRADSRPASMGGRQRRWREPPRLAPRSAPSPVSASGMAGGSAPPPPRPAPAWRRASPSA